MGSLSVAMDPINQGDEEGLCQNKATASRARSSSCPWKAGWVKASAFILLGLNTVLLVSLHLARSSNDNSNDSTNAKLDKLIAQTSRDTPACFDTDVRVECLFGLGGGTVRATGGLPQSHLNGPGCKKTFDWYFDPDGGGYWKELNSVRDDALSYYIQQKAVPGNDDTQLVIFDIDETVLSNLDDMRARDYGLPTHKLQSMVNNTSTKQNDDVEQHDAPALSAIKEVYLKLYAYGMSVAFITGRSEDGREETEKNLKDEGFGEKCEVDKHGKAVRREDGPCYLELHMRSLKDDMDSLASVYKPQRRKTFLDAGYTIVGSFGDQFSDLEGLNSALASWKLPNPLYYIL